MEANVGSVQAILKLVIILPSERDESKKSKFEWRIEEEEGDENGEGGRRGVLHDPIED